MFGLKILNVCIIIYSFVKLTLMICIMLVFFLWVVFLKELIKEYLCICVGKMGYYGKDSV